MSIKIAGLTVNYDLKDDGLFILNPPDNFILEVQVRIHPESKTDLNGCISPVEISVLSVRQWALGK